MRLLYSFSISFLLIYMCCALAKIQCKQKKYAIIFDLMNVIIKENYGEFVKKIGYGNIASYTLTHWKHPGHRCLDMLNTISNHETQQPHVQVTLKQRIMPRCLVELQEGKKTALQTKNEIVQCIELLDQQKYFNSNKEKTLMTAIMNIILDPQATASMIEPIKSTIQLAQKLKSAGHSIYLFANAPAELYTTVQKKYPDILTLFDGIIISSKINVIKPDPAIFNHLLNAHNLIPQDCILIDDLEETVSVAKQLGMQAFVYDKITTIKRELKKCGVML